MRLTRGHLWLGAASAVITFSLIAIGWRLFWQGPTECVNIPASDCAAVSEAIRDTDLANNTSSLVIDPAPREWADLGPTSAYPSYDRAEWRIMAGEGHPLACWREDGEIVCVGPDPPLDTF